MDPSRAVLVRASIDTHLIDVLVARLRGLAQLLHDLAAGIRRASPAGWSGAGRQAFDRVGAHAEAQLEAQAGALDTVCLALSSLSTSGQSLQAELAVARRIAATAGVDAGPAATQQLGAAGQAFEDADQRTAVLLMDVLLRSPLRQVGLLHPSLAGRGTLLVEHVTQAPQLPAEPAAVALWWAGLPASTRAVQPADVIGGLDGVPSKVRDAANRASLARALEAAERHYADVRAHGIAHQIATVAGWLLPAPLSWAAGQLDRELKDAKHRVDALRELRADLTQPGMRLIEFDPQGDGRAVVASGDTDTGANVAVVVPGLNTELDDVPRLIEQSAKLAVAAGSGTVVVSWLGYDAPNVLQVAGDGKAKAGSHYLRRFTAGLRAAASARQHLTVVGHSYGTLVAGLAARSAPVADDLVLLASPGVGASSAQQLQIPAGHVWAARAGSDPIQLVFWPGKVVSSLGLPGPYIFGPDPASAAFGATHFAIGGAHGHSGYFSNGSQSLANLGRIVTSRPPLPKAP